MHLKRLSAASLLFFFASVALSQATEPKPAAQTKPKTTRTAAASESEAEKLRREQARQLLVALSTDARTFSDSMLRARSLARIADALWQADEEQSRLLFRKAWEAAEATDADNEVKQQEKIRQQQARTGGGFAGTAPPSLRREVLRLTAKHDRVLSEEFLDKLKSQKPEASATTSGTPGRLNESLSQRLSVARELLLSGEVEKAVEFAGPALGVVSTGSLNFLSDVRDKNAELADARYAALLSIAAGNPQSDANTVSMLSSYIYTPRMFVIFADGGTSTSQSSSTIVPANVSSELRMAFFQTAANILVHPLPQTNEQNPTPNTGAIEAKYFVLKRMLPFFEQSAPAEMVESLRGQLNALNSIVSDNARRRDDEWEGRGTRAEKPAAEREQSLLDRVDRAKTSNERDGIYVELAFLMARRPDPKARDYVSKIEDPELRKKAQAYIDPTLIKELLRKKLVDQSLDLALKGDLTHPIRSWALTECAKLVLPTDRTKALELLDSASDEAHRIEVSDPNLPRALLAVANAMFAIDPTRAWDVTFDAVKAANSAVGFTGEDGGIVLTFESRYQTSVSTHDVAEFNVEGIFKQLSLKDYERAVELARGFQGEGPRAVATIAIAKAVLEQKKVATK